MQRTDLEEIQEDDTDTASFQVNITKYDMTRSSKGMPSNFHFVSVGREDSKVSFSKTTKKF